MSNIIDDKSEHVIPFLLKAYEEHLIHRFQNKGAPMFVGLNGVQGCGKSTLVANVAKEMREKHNLNTLVLSLDDLYLTHEKQVELARAHPENPLVQHRGEPGKQSLYFPSILWFLRGLSQSRNSISFLPYPCHPSPSPFPPDPQSNLSTRNTRPHPCRSSLRAPPQKRSLPSPLLRQVRKWRSRRASAI